MSTSIRPSLGVPRFEDAADYAACRETFAAAGYTAPNICRRLCVEVVPAVGTTNNPLFQWRTRGGDALDTLIRLFVMGVAVSDGAVRAAVSPATLDKWIDAGLLCGAGLQPAGKEQAGSQPPRATGRLVPYNGMLIANDLNPRTADEVRSDYVMGVGAATTTLANATVRRPVRSTLDLGSGCGTLSLLAAAHSESVVALDRNPRAVEFARFNARLNGVENVEHLEGNLFEPVADREFDLIVTNPPFVISPESRYLFRDSGMKGDEICRTIIRQAPRHLAEGGHCQMLCNWAHLKGRDWKAELSGWFEGSGCVAWVIRSETQDAATYADVWIRQTERHELERSPQIFEDWMRYYERNGIEAVSAGLVCLRRASGRPNWVRFDDAPPKMFGPIGEDVARGFETYTLLAAADDAALLASRPRVDPHLRMEQQCEPAEGGWRVTEVTLARTVGLAHKGRADPYVAKLLAQCTGERPLGQLVAELAAEVNRTPAEMTPVVLGVVRQLMEQGFLAPAGGAATSAR
jgi:hypothetical protein